MNVPRLTSLLKWSLAGWLCCCAPSPTRAQDDELDRDQFRFDPDVQRDYPLFPDLFRRAIIDAKQRRAAERAARMQAILAGAFPAQSARAGEDSIRRKKIERYQKSVELVIAEKAFYENGVVRVDRFLQTIQDAGEDAIALAANASEVAKLREMQLALRTQIELRETGKYEVGTRRLDELLCAQRSRMGAELALLEARKAAGLPLELPPLPAELLGGDLEAIRERARKIQDGARAEERRYLEAEKRKQREFTEDERDAPLRPARRPRDR